MYHSLKKLFARATHKCRPAATPKGNRKHLVVDELAQRELPSANPLAIRSFADAARPSKEDLAEQAIIECPRAALLRKD